MERMLKWLYILIFIILILSMGIYILFLQERHQRLQDAYLQQALTHVGFIYVNKLDQYKIDSGKYPESLEDLFPKYITEGNLRSAFTMSRIIERKYTIGDLLAIERQDLIQSQIPRVDLWDGWDYAPSSDKDTFDLNIIYEDSRYRTSLHYSPEGGDFFTGVALTLP